MKWGIKDFPLCAFLHEVTIIKSLIFVYMKMCGFLQKYILVWTSAYILMWLKKFLYMYILHTFLGAFKFKF